MLRIKPHPTLTRLFALALCAVLLFGAFSATLAEEAQTAQKTVRIGYVSAKNYEEGGPGEYKRGAGYEYLQKISYITGWKYEYVYGTFKDCLQQLIDGEIDLFGNVSYTQERASQMLFSTYTQGKDVYWLHTDVNHPALLTGDLKALNGCRIGVTSNSFQESLLKEWLEANQIEATLVGCSGFAEMMEKIDAGEIDTFTAPDLSPEYGYRVVIGIGSSDYYFVVSNGRPDLLEELNAALFEIQSAETDYNTMLTQKYEYKAATGWTLNAEELEWLAAHDNTIRLGILEDYLPFSGIRNGETAGVVTALIDSLKNDYGVTVALTTYKDMCEMDCALTENKIDLYGPVAGDLYLTELGDRVLSDAILQTTPVMIYKKGLSDRNPVIATSQSGIFTPDMVNVLFPDSPTKEYADVYEGMRAVSREEAGGVLIPSARINVYKTDPLMENLSFAEFTNRTEICLTGSKLNRRAVTIFNKAISRSSVSLNGMVLAESADEGGMNLAAFIRQNAWTVITALGTVLAVFAVLVLFLMRNRRKLTKALADANRANEAKTVFLSNMSHDIRTPMNAILGYAMLLEREFEAQDTNDYIGKIRSSGEYLLSIINDVLDMARIDSGKMTIDETFFPISDGIGLDEMFRNDIAKKNMHFTEEVEIKHPYVFADRAKVSQIVINLVSNAIKYTPEYGTVRVFVKEMPCEKPGFATYVMTVADNGIGMSKEFQQHLFDSFTREQSTTESKINGTGLGLSIVKKLVDLLGGKIVVESETGKGSRFTVTFTLRVCDDPEQYLSKKKAEEATVDLTGRRILLAEDNALNAEIAIALLKDSGVTVDHAEDGVICLDLLTKSAPGTYDFILMDVQMPNLDGYETTRRIRALNDPKKARIPIVAMTANAFEEDKQKALESGMNDFVPKPIDLALLMKVIAKIVGR
ncbi:MAG: ATP-binding protein [Clostridia bacterium]|nr:ATP-binding protein [Clostridia bacterium]